LGGPALCCFDGAVCHGGGGVLTRSMRGGEIALCAIGVTEERREGRYGLVRGGFGGDRSDRKCKGFRSLEGREDVVMTDDANLLIYIARPQRCPDQPHPRVTRRLSILSRGRTMAITGRLEMFRELSQRDALGIANIKLERSRRELCISGA
jgi:hypothetical protein